MVAPRQLPFAPKPMAMELLSSWLLRVAAANFISLSDLLRGFESQYGPALPSGLMEHSLSDAAVASLSQFCRIAPKQIQALDLCRQAPELNPNLVLRFRKRSSVDLRCVGRRARYSFCVDCLSEQPFIYVRWEWVVACLPLCGVHGTLLLDGCRTCREPDPLVFSGFEVCPERTCRSCRAELGPQLSRAGLGSNMKEAHTVGNAYREALLGVAHHPVMLGQTTDQEFRQFIEDLMTMLTSSLNSARTGERILFPRQDIIRIVAALILNAAPSPDPSTRGRRYQRGLSLWSCLLSVIPQRTGDQFEEACLRWPLALRRRFAAALRYRTQKRWPFSPYRASKDKERRIERGEIAAVYGLPDGVPR